MDLRLSVCSSCLLSRNATPFCLQEQNSSGKLATREGVLAVVAEATRLEVRDVAPLVLCEVLDIL
jgi:hypothetical protein